MFSTVESTLQAFCQLYGEIKRKLIGVLRARGRKKKVLYLWHALSIHFLYFLHFMIIKRKRHLSELEEKLKDDPLNCNRSLPISYLKKLMLNFAFSEMFTQDVCNCVG